MKILAFALVICLSACALYRSSDFNMTGPEMLSSQLKDRKPLSVNVSTSCNNVAFGADPYIYDGVAKSGYLSTGRHGSALAFIFYGKEGATLPNIKKYPTLIWLNGGPGSSSQLGNLMELGPFWVVPDAEKPYKVIRNKWAWTKEYNILFIDQPVGTGLSYADTNVQDPYVHNMTQVASDFYGALFEMYGSKGCFSGFGITPDMDLFIFGESYAGKYVPAIAAHILEEAEKGGFLKGLRGAAIGDGFTSPYQILAEMGGFAYNLGLLDYQQRSRIEQVIVNATYQHRNQLMDDLHNSFEIVLDAIERWTGGINVYDLTKYKRYPTGLVAEYFADPAVRKMYALSDQIEFGAQSDKVYKALFTDFMRDEVHLVEYCLSKKLPILIYNGQNDIIVENPGTMRWVEQIHFADGQKFRETLFKTWKVNGKVAGSVKKAGFLEFRIVNNAGHLVPMDQGENALFMLKEFVEPLRKTTKLE